MTEKIHYPFKTLDNLFTRDAPFTGTIEPYHTALDAIRLHNGVPAEIRQLFETAKNISLYAFFAYRMNQPAELIGYSAFEMALRVRAQIEAPELFLNSKKQPLLAKLCQLAKEKSWLSAEGFTHLKNRAYRQARSAKMIALSERMRAEGLTEAEFEAPTEDEVSSVLKTYTDFADPLLESIRGLRNNLAHGSSILMPSSIRTLDFLAEAINQLFTEPTDA